MPIDPEKAVGLDLGETMDSYDRDRVILYHLGIGAGVPPTDPRELAYTFERDLKVLPSFAVIPGTSGLTGLGKSPGLQFELAQLLHGEQEIRIHRPLPAEATLRNTGRVAEIYDKVKAALVILETESAIAETGEPLFTNRTSLFVRGEGGFGGDRGPKIGNLPPKREPDGVIETATFPQQALLYRLSGDKNPLHADPAIAKLAGFDRPIIHGLCSYGIACKAIVDHVLDGDVTRIERYQARFSGVAFPGETYLTSWWREGDTILFHVNPAERDATVISNAAIALRS